MKNILFSAVVFLGLSTVFQAANAAPNDHDGQKKKMIEVKIVPCNGPHMGVFKNNDGEYQCVALKDQKDVP